MSSFSLLLTVFEASGGAVLATSVLVVEVVGIGVATTAAVAPFGKVSAGPGGGWT